MSIDEQTKIENEWCVKQFATHKANLIQDTDRYFIADWRRTDGSGDYYINFILDKKRGSLIISGDVGDCIATWYNALTLKNLNSYIRHDVEYFISKFQASSDKYIYDNDDVLSDIKEHFAECDIEVYSGIGYDSEEEFWDLVDEEVADSCDGDYYRPTERLVELNADYDRDYWEWLPYCGKRINRRVYLWVYSFDQVLRQLGYVGGGKNAADI